MGVGHLCLLIDTHQSQAPTSNCQWETEALSPAMITFQGNGSQVLVRHIPGL